MADLDIIIPVYNEGRNIIPVLNGFRSHVRTPFRIFICYDFDEDDTLNALAEFAAEDMDIVLVKNPGRGPHRAVCAGLALSTAPAALVYMADDDYNTDIIDLMFAKVRGGCDVVAASRFIPGGSMVGGALHKVVVVRLGTFALHHLARLPVHDCTNAFRMFSRRLLDTVEIESERGSLSASNCLSRRCVSAGRSMRWRPNGWSARTSRAVFASSRGFPPTCAG